MGIMISLPASCASVCQNSDCLRLLPFNYAAPMRYGMVAGGFMKYAAAYLCTRNEIDLTNL